VLEHLEDPRAGAARLCGAARAGRRAPRGHAGPVGGGRAPRRAPLVGLPARPTRT
jgi:hypothetical protein